MKIKDIVDLEQLNSDNVLYKNKINKFKSNLIERGDIFSADLTTVMDSKFGDIRPVLIIQNDIGNKYCPTVIVAVITSRINKGKLPTHVEISYEKHGLNKDSIVLLEQITTLDKRRLREKIGHITYAEMINIDNAIMFSHGIGNVKNKEEQIEKYYRFFLNGELNFTEDYESEFKEVVEDDLKKFLNKTILKYCVGFLNSSGGNLYYGITDKRIVKGVKIKCNEIDDIKKTINNNLYNITPRISLDHFKVNFKDVYDKNNQKIKDLYVIQIVVVKSNSKSIYFANDKELFIRGNGCTKKLGGMEMTSYIRKKLMDGKGAN